MKNLRKAILGTIVGILVFNTIQAGAADTESASPAASCRNWSVGAFPVLLYSDETRIALGGGAQVMLDNKGERFASSLGLLGFCTQNKQYMFILAPEIYLNHGAYKMTGNIGYSHFPDSFYGIGNSAVKNDEEKYTGRLGRINPILQAKLSANLFAGVHYDFLYGKVLDADENGWLADGGIPGSEGGHASGAGANLTWDSRDNNVYPSSGSYHQISVTSFGPALGSDYTYTSYTVDFRHYRKVFGTHVVAFQGVSCINTGQPSFQYMNEVSSLGKYLRGYTRTLYVDKNVLAVQAEYRLPLKGRFGLVAFAGFGQVAGKLGRIAIDEFKPSAGMGIRFALIPGQKVNLRLDVGVGEDDSSLDISLMEMF